MIRHMNIKGISQETFDKYLKVKKIIRQEGVKLNKILPLLLDKALDDFLKDPDVKQFF